MGDVMADVTRFTLEIRADDEAQAELLTIVVFHVVWVHKGGWNKL